ncbi:hypothetical protein TWF730_004318 [Orbilia blumenaviensis]|uniref:F-box domain-containing protein n=1 Tax=Orbilia blumenaviensis TaxID=1796055 RepID=A0AAV9U2G6_9PEZI
MDSLSLVDMAQELQSSLPHLLLLPSELILEISSYLTDSGSGQGDRHLTTLSQTCRRLRQVIYPIANRHLRYDEDTQFPDTLLSIVTCTFTNPLVEYVRSVTIRLRREGGSIWLRDEYDEVIETGIAELKGHLRRKAQEGEEIFEFLESQLDEYGMAVLPTILLFQLKNLKELELAPTIHAISSRFMLTTLHYFQLPFQLNRLGMVRLTDLAPVNYWLLERFLRCGPIEAVGIDYRFGSTRSGPKAYPELEYLTDESEFESDTDDDSSTGSVESVGWQESSWREPTMEELKERYEGYQPSGWRDCWYPTKIDYGLPGTEPLPDCAFEVRDIRLWMDETPSGHEKLTPLLHSITGLRRLDLYLFPMRGNPSMGLEGEVPVSDTLWLSKLLMKQTETLESITIRLTQFADPQPEIPYLDNFKSLRKVHLYWSSDTLGTFKTINSAGEPYFKKMFPPGLEFLRIDFCQSLEFIEDAINLQVADFPKLKIVLGMLKEVGMPWEMAEGLQSLWLSMDYSNHPRSGAWSKVDQEVEVSGHLKTTQYMVAMGTDAHKVWRRKIQFVILSNAHKYTWCSTDGWRGAFQEHSFIDLPWNSRYFIALEPSNEGAHWTWHDYRNVDTPAGQPWVGSWFESNWPSGAETRCDS